MSQVNTVITAAAVVAQPGLAASSIALFDCESKYVTDLANAEQSRIAWATLFAGWLELPEYDAYVAKRATFIEQRKQYWLAKGKEVSDAAHTKAWERAIKLIETEFEYSAPKATTKEAVQKSESREKLESAANVMLSQKGRPDAEAVREAAIAKVTGNKDQKAQAAIVLKAHEIAKAKDAADSKAVRDEVYDLWKTADIRHLQLALIAFKTAIPQDAEATIVVKTKKAKAVK